MHCPLLVSPRKRRRKVKKSKSVKIPKKEFVEEHVTLIKILKSPSKKDDKKEAKKQGKELKKIKK